MRSTARHGDRPTKTHARHNRPQPYRIARADARPAFSALERATQDGDEVAARRIRNQLVVDHLNLVHYLAKRFAARGEPLDDLLQVATVGLMKAVDRFRLDRGVEFTTYATPTIVGEIKRYFRDHCWALRMPRRLQELNVSLHYAIETLSIRFGRSPTVSELATAIHASPEEVLQTQEIGTLYHVYSLDAELRDDGKASTSFEDIVGFEDARFGKCDDHAILERGLQTLPGRERVILYLHFFESISQTEIARRLNVSQMHISRLEKRALDKLRVALQNVN